MYNYYFVVPKAIYYCCIIPALIIAIACILFTLIYRQKKETKYYSYTLNYVYNISSILICLLLFPLLLGYSVVMFHIINKDLVMNVSLLLKVLLVVLPIIPFVTLIYALRKFIKNLKLKDIIDEKDRETFDEIKSLK